MNYNSPKAYFHPENIVYNEHIFFTDGGCQNNNKKTSSERKMIVCVVDYQGNPIILKRLQGGSNNIAEWSAVKEALWYALDNKIIPIHIYTDSTNNLAWWNKITNHAPEKAKEMKSEIADLRNQVNATISWVPREHNLAGIYLEKQGW